MYSPRSSYEFLVFGFCIGIWSLLVLSCQNNAPNHLSGRAAQFRMELQANCSAATPEQAFEQFKAYTLKQRIQYQNIAFDPTSQKITIDLIEETMDGKTLTLEDIRALLTAKREVTIVPATYLSDKAMLDFADSLLVNTDVGRYLQFVATDDYGYQLSMIGAAAKDSTAFVDAILQENGTEDFVFVWGNGQELERYGMQDQFIGLFAYSKRAGRITNQHLLEASLDFNSFGGNGEPLTLLKFDEKGTEQFARMTTQAAHNNQKAILIIVDGTVVSAPRVMSPITGGMSSITAQSKEEAEEMSNILEYRLGGCDWQIVQQSVL